MNSPHLPVVQRTTEHGNALSSLTVELADSDLVGLMHTLNNQPVGKIQINKDQIPLLDPDTSLKETIHVMNQKQFGYAIVARDNVPLGFFTERNFLTHVAHSMMARAKNAPRTLEALFDEKVSNWMRRPEDFLEPHWRVGFALRKMHQYNIRRFPVVEPGEGGKMQLTGAVSQRTIVRHLINQLPPSYEQMPLDPPFVCPIQSKKHLDELLEDEQHALDPAIAFPASPQDQIAIARAVFNPPVCSAMDATSSIPLCSVESKLNEVLSQMILKGRGYAIALDADGKPVGVFTERDFLYYVEAQIVNRIRSKPEKIDQEIFNQPIAPFMSVKVVTAYPEASILSALTRMTRHGYRRLPVVDPHTEQILGAVSERTIVNYILDIMPHGALHGLDQPQRWLHADGR